MLQLYALDIMYNFILIEQTENNKEEARLDFNEKSPNPNEK